METGKEIKEEKDKIIHLVYTPFTGVGLCAGYRGDKWFRHRIRIFKEYTLKSLLNQTNKDFIHWFSFRPQEYNNPMVFELMNYLTEKNYPAIFTFGGLIYWDDKFPITVPKKILNVARIIRNHLIRERRISGLFSDVFESFQDKNKNLEKRLEDQLSILREKLGTDYDWVYLTRIDSDDMLHKEAASTIRGYEPRERLALTMKNGYVYNTQTGELAEWNPTTNPPFHTIVYPAELFFNARKHLDYLNGFKSHEDVPSIFSEQKLPDPLYSYVIHGKEKKSHISTGWNHPFRGKILKKKTSSRNSGFESHEDIKRLFNCIVLKDGLYTVSIHSTWPYYHISTEWTSKFRGKIREDKLDIFKDYGII